MTCSEIGPCQEEIMITSSKEAPSEKAGKRRASNFASYSDRGSFGY